MKNVVDSLRDSVSNSHSSSEVSDKQKELLSACGSVLGEWLDRQKGKDVTDNSIFSDLPRHYEESFNRDMEALNVS